MKDGYGYGLAQWTYYSRKQELLDYAVEQKASVGNLDMQLDFLIKELSKSYYSSVLSTLKSATTVKEASDAVLTGYEKPANQSDSAKIKRAGYGQTYYDKYAGDCNPLTSSSASTGSASTSAAGRISKSSKNKLARLGIVVMTILDRAFSAWLFVQFIRNQTQNGGKREALTSLKHTIDA